MNAPISTLMERRVHCVSMDHTVAQVERLFSEQDLRWAPVVDADTAVGVLSVSDLVQFHAQGRDTATKAWQLCTYKPATVSPDTPVAEVARLMVERRIHHVVVADAKGIVGVVSSLDFVRTFTEA